MIIMGTSECIHVSSVSYRCILQHSVIIKRAESISRRLSAFMPLVPGIALSLVASSIHRNDPTGDYIGAKMVVSEETALSVDTLKELISMLSLAIQALYGSKKGGLLSAKAASKGGVQMNKAKKVFVSGANEFVPILLQVVSLLDEPIQLSRQLNGNKKQPKTAHAVQNEELNADRQTSESDQTPEQVQRKRADSTDKDWVDVHHSPKPEPSGNQTSSDALESPSTISSSTKSSRADATKNTPERKSGRSLEQSVLEDLCSVQDMALYAVSRLIAQAMKYGGGEASTAVWRRVISALSGDSLMPPTSTNGDKLLVSNSVDSSDRSGSSIPLPPSLDACKAASKSTLCHLAALVLSKFVHNRQETHRSPWNLETCSAVARLMDLIEEKKLLCQPEKMNRRGSNISFMSDGSWKYGIDQVRLLKALLEVMLSGRESGGWEQIKPRTSKKNDVTKKEHASIKGVGQALPHSNYELYNQSSSDSHHQLGHKKSDGSSNSKLLLPILQSCVRIVVPATGIIRSEAVVITAAHGNSPTTARPLELVCTELHKSLVASIEGLSFPVARDVFMNAVATLRRSISHHELVEDKKAVVLCSTLVIIIIKKMRSRYLEESSRKEKATFDAYEGDRETKDQGDEQETTEETSTPSKVEKNISEGLHSQVIEKLILGDDELPKNDADFVAFPGDANSAEDPSKMLVSPMGWAHYKGLGAALNRCYREVATVETTEEKAQLLLSILESYMDSWDRIQIQDAAEAELVDLFDESINFSSTSKALLEDFNGQGQLKAPHSAKKTSSALVPSLSASDAMARFIEAQSVLRHQHQYLAFEYLLRRRFGRSAFVERLCWKIWMDCMDTDVSSALWERVSRHCFHSCSS